MQILLILVLVSFVSSYSTSGTYKKLSLRHRRSFWDDVSTEFFNDVSRGLSCVSAVQAFVEENPEVTTVARRSISGPHRLFKIELSNWLNEINPVKYFYNCGTFLKNIEAQIYNLINKTAGNQYQDILVTFQAASKILSRNYEASLNQTIKSVNKIESYLNSAEIPDVDLGEKVLHKSIKNVRSVLESFSSGYEKETAEGVFSNVLNIFPQVSSSLNSLDWTGLTMFQPDSDIAKVVKIVNDLKKSNLAHNVMTIVYYVQTVNPDFLNQLKSGTEKVELFAEQQHLKDLAGGTACLHLLLQIHELGNQVGFFSFNYLQPLGYLNEARKCGVFVSEHSGQGDGLVDMLEVSMKLSDFFSKSISESEKVLSSLEELLTTVEKPGVRVDGQMFKNAVGQIKTFLAENFGQNSGNMTEYFSDALQALEMVKEMTTGWSLLGNKKEELVEEISQLLKSKNETNVDGSVGFLSHTSFIDSVEIAQSFINLFQFAVIHPMKNNFIV